jgi:hypothetical protein
MGSHQLQRGSSTDLLTGVGAGASVRAPLSAARAVRGGAAGRARGGAGGGARRGIASHRILTRRVVHEVMEVLREQRRELAHAVRVGVWAGTHLVVLCTPEEEAWALRRRRSTMMTDSSLAAPSVTASEEEAERGSGAQRGRGAGLQSRHRPDPLPFSVPLPQNVRRVVDQLNQGSP